MEHHNQKRWFNIQLDEELYQFLKQYSEKGRMPMSTIIRQYILKLKREASESQAGSPLKRQD